MPLYKNYPVSDRVVFTVDSGGGTPAGKSSTVVASPIRGRVIKAAACYSGSVLSTTTLAVVKWNANGSTNIIASAAMSTADTPLGMAAIVDVASPVFVDEGDGIQFITSGGPTSTTAANYYAIIRP